MKSVLVDTSVWVAHFKQHNESLTRMLEMDMAMTHPMVLGEIACGTPPDRARTLLDLADLRPAQQASLREVMAFMERESIYGIGCGLIELMLLASVLITPDTELWTLDKRLAALAQRFGVLHEPTLH